MTLSPSIVAQYQHSEVSEQQLHAFFSPWSTQVTPKFHSHPNTEEEGNKTCQEVISLELSSSAFQHGRLHLTKLLFLGSLILALTGQIIGT